MRQSALVFLLGGVISLATYTEAQSVIYRSTTIRQGTKPTKAQCDADLEAWDKATDKWRIQYARDTKAASVEEKITTEELYRRSYEAKACIATFVDSRDVSHVVEIKSFEDYIVNANTELLSRAVYIMDDHHLAQEFLQFERQ
jgi:hypothetical protein